MKDIFNYYLIRFLTFPFCFMPYKTLHFLGKVLGTLTFYLVPKFRKRALSNLSLASDLKLTNKEIIFYAKKSFQNLAINLLEYPKFSQEKNLSKIIKCENPNQAFEIYKKGQGIIFFCGHLANWEVLFLEGTSRMKGVAIGMPINNKKLYRWIISIREKKGGKIINPKSALKEGLKNLKKGIFLGIVGDQAMPDSSYSFPFLGRKAWISNAPALLSYKINAPIIVATTRREKKGYIINYSDPIWPDVTKTLEEESIKLMDRSLNILQEAIKKRPGQWLWQHNIYKQQSLKNIYKRFRQDAICLILPEENFEKIAYHLPEIKKIYPREFIYIIMPKKFKDYPLIPVEEIHYYNDLEETLLDDFRFKLVFNFTNFSKIKKHYKKLSAFDVLNLEDLKKIASPYLKTKELNNLSKILQIAICRPQKNV
jgi:Kdo2-lipid IVA lauroyltransferase/acyltransferase